MYLECYSKEWFVAHSFVTYIAYLMYNDYNVIMVDWQPLAANTFYLGPMRNTERVGQTAAEFIDFLIKETGANTKDIHFLGTQYGHMFIQDKYFSSTIS